MTPLSPRNQQPAAYGACMRSILQTAMDILPPPFESSVMEKGPGPTNSFLGVVGITGGALRLHPGLRSYVYGGWVRCCGARVGGVPRCSSLPSLCHRVAVGPVASVPIVALDAYHLVQVGLELYNQTSPLLSQVHGEVTIAS